MPKTRKQKEQMIKSSIEDLNKAKSIVFANYHGLTVNEIQELKSQASEQKVKFNVIKNTLFKRAIKESNLKDIDLGDFSGPKATAYGFEDEVAPAKILHQFTKKHKALQLISGILGTKLLSKKDIINLAKLPSKLEMIAKTVATIKAPISGFVNVLSGNLRGLITVLSAIKDKKPAK